MLNTFRIRACCMRLYYLTSKSISILWKRTFPILLYSCMLHCKFRHSSPRIFSWDIIRSTIIIIHYRDFIFNLNNWRLIHTNLCIRYYIAKHVYLYARNTCYYITKNDSMYHLIDYIGRLWFKALFCIFFING